MTASVILVELFALPSRSSLCCFYLLRFVKERFFRCVAQFLCALDQFYCYTLCKGSSQLWSYWRWNTDNANWQ